MLLFCVLIKSAGQVGCPFVTAQIIIAISVPHYSGIPFYLGPASEIDEILTKNILYLLQYLHNQVGK